MAAATVMSFTSRATWGHRAIAIVPGSPAGVYRPPITARATSSPIPGIIGFIGPRRALRSEEHTSELQSLMRTSYAVFCWKTTKLKQATIQINLHNIQQNHNQKY